MPVTRELAVRRGQLMLLVGTTKGAFFFASPPARRNWSRGGPYFAGQAVNAFAHDARGGDRLFAGTENHHFGAGIVWSDDLGRTWTNLGEASLRFPQDTEASLQRVWQIEPGPDGVLYAGVEPSALFVSRDRGANWELVRGLWDHPHRPRWEPGGGGKCLHTILPDLGRGGRITVAMSTGGVYRSDDGGQSWSARNVGVRAEFLPDKFPEFGQCVHKIVRHPSRPDTMFLQNHWGLYRSDDGGDSWRDIARGVPSDFGFCMAVHPHDPDTVYIVPLESDGYRCTPEGRLRVYRTSDGGDSWQPLTNGLPQRDANETVLRDAMAVDPLNPAGVYFGTRSGKLFGSPNGGASWSLIADGLPPVLCVRVASIGDPAKMRVARPQRSSAKKTSAAKSRAGTKPRPARKALASAGARSASKAQRSPSRPAPKRATPRRRANR